MITKISYIIIANVMKMHEKSHILYKFNTY